MVKYAAAGSDQSTLMRICSQVIQDVTAKAAPPAYWPSIGTLRCTCSSTAALLHGTVLKQLVIGCLEKIEWAASSNAHEMHQPAHICYRVISQQTLGCSEFLGFR